MGKKRNMINTQGFTLIELLVYIALLVVVATLIAGFVPHIVRGYLTTQAKEETLTNTISALETINQEVRHATSIYQNTSELHDHPGQLSLETQRSAPDDETTTYVDFYLDGDRLYMKREGEEPTVITSTKVEITNLTFILFGGENQPAIQTEMSVRYADTSETIQNRSVTTLRSIASLRSY